MDDAKQRLVRNWLIKAQHDQAAARKMAADPDPYLDTAIYHCQQAAEKAVKGFLVFHDQPFEKTHDLRLLVTQAAVIEARFSAYLDAAALLTPMPQPSAIRARSWPRTKMSLIRRCKRLTR